MVKTLITGHQRALQRPFPSCILGIFMKTFETRFCKISQLSLTIFITAR